MIWVIVALAAAALVAAEKYWTPYALNALRFKGQCSKDLAEPNEPLTWRATASNSGRLSIPFVRMRMTFPAEIRIEAKEAWLDAHCQRGIYRTFVEERLSVRRGGSITKQLTFSLPRRGKFTLGSCQLSVGDLLGFEEKSELYEGDTLVICPERSQNTTKIEALGGFLGDVSVRRFILEDPMLTVGFRDYTGREPMKSISWTATAASGSLKVKQFDHTAEQTVTVLLNVEGGTPEELEECFRLCRTACEALERKKIPFSLRTNGDLQGPVGRFFYLPEGLGSRHLGTILYALGQASYTCFQTLPYLVKQTLHHRKNNESYIVITPPMDPAARGCLRQLEAAVGSALCILTADAEVSA